MEETIFAMLTQSGCEITAGTENKDLEIPEGNALKILTQIFSTSNTFYEREVNNTSAALNKFSATGKQKANLLACSHFFPSHA